MKVGRISMEKAARLIICAERWASRDSVRIMSKAGKGGEIWKKGDAQHLKRQPRKFRNLANRAKWYHRHSSRLGRVVGVNSEI